MKSLIATPQIFCQNYAHVMDEHIYMQHFVNFINIFIYKVFIYLLQVTIYHQLKLFHTDSNVMLGKKHLVNEIYDELVFQEPSAMMHQCLTNTRPLTLAPYKHDIDCKSCPYIASRQTAQNCIQHQKSLPLSL